MSRVGFSTVRNGRKVSSGNGGSNFSTLETLKYEIGEKKRVIFPIYNGGLVIFAQPFHKVLNDSVKLMKADGSSTYAIHKIRCTHPYSQLSDKDTKEVLETGDMCLFCNIAKYEERKMWATVGEEFGAGFKDLSSKEKKEFFDTFGATRTVEASYYKKKADDGSVNTRTNFDMYILALEVDASTTTNAVANYKPIIMPISSQRLDKFKTAIDDAISSGAVDESSLHSYVENAGTPYEETVLIGWVDFMMNFPRSATKMESGRNVTVTPVAERLSAVNEALINKFNAEAEKVFADAEHTVNRFFKYLQVHDHEKAKEMLDRPAGFYDTLEENFRVKESFTANNGSTVKSDDELDDEIFAKVREALSVEPTESTVVEEEVTEEVVDEVVEEEVETEAPKGRRGRKAKEVEVEADEDFDDFE